MASSKPPQMATISELGEEAPEQPSDVGLLSSSRFLQRLTKMNIVDCAMTKASSSYSRVKEATPSMVRPAVDSAELTALNVVNQMTALVQSLPLPLHLADQLACAGLDRLEYLAQYKQGILDRLHQLTPDRLKSAPLTDEEKSFYFDLLGFVSSTKDMVTNGLRSNLTFFIETELALLECVEGVLKNLHSTELGTRLNSTLPDKDLAGQIQTVKQVFEHAIQQQKEIVSWALGDNVDHNPLDPVWKHLQSAAQKLTPNEDVIKALQDKVTLFKDILKAAIEQIKVAAKDSEELFVHVRTKFYLNAVGLARAFLPQFALNSIQRLTGLSLEAPLSTDVPTSSTTSSTETDNELSANTSEIRDSPSPPESATKKRRSAQKKSVTIVDHVEFIDNDVEEEARDSSEDKEANDDAQDSYEDATVNCESGSQPEASVDIEHESEIVEEMDDDADGSGEGNEESVDIDNANAESEKKRRSRNRRKKNKRTAENSSTNGGSSNDHDYYNQSAE